MKVRVALLTLVSFVVLSFAVTDVVRAVDGGSISFNGTNQYLSLPGSSDWAVGTGDFTVEFDINQKMYEYFLNEFYNPIGSKEKEESGDFYSPALYLKKHLTEEIGRALTKSLKERHAKEAAEDGGHQAHHHKQKTMAGGLPRREEVLVKDI